MPDISAVLSAAVTSARVVTWTGLSSADSGLAHSPAGHGAIAGSVQVEGTFGGATVTLQASNDGINWETISDVQGNAISFTAAGIAEFSSAAVYIRPNSTGGTADDVNVTLAMRG